MRIGILGINHKLASLQLRDLLAKICNRRLHPSSSTHGNHSFVLLSTCNRTEVYFSSTNLAETHSYLLSILRNDISDDFDQKLYSYFGQDCLLHLSRVTSGLDSALIAETEIQGQVKNAYEQAQQFHKLPFELHYLFQKSFSVAKKVRTLLPSKPGLPDIGQAVYQTGRHFFNEEKDPAILFIGASDINEQILSLLKTKNLKDITLCNRSEVAGGKFAAKHDIPLITWNKMEDWPTYDWIILGTKAPGFLIHKYTEQNETCGHKLIIDLSVPRNVNPGLARHSKITLLNIDQINRRLKTRKKNLFQALYHAEELVQKMTCNQMKIFHEKQMRRLNGSTCEQLISTC